MVWNIHSSEPIASLRPPEEPATFDNHRHFWIGDTHSPHPMPTPLVACSVFHPITALKHSGQPNFYTDNRHRHFLVTDWSNTRNKNANIWDLQTQKHVHTLCMGSDWDHYKVACHPTLPILATSHSDGSIVCLWNTRYYRLETILQLPESHNPGLIFITSTEDVTRLVTQSQGGTSIVEIKMPTSTWTGIHNGGEN